MDAIAKAVLNRLLARFINGFNLDVSLRSGSAEVRDVKVDVAALDKSLLSATSAVLAFMKLVAPNVPTSQIAGDGGWANEGVAKVRAIATPSSAQGVV